MAGARRRPRALACGAGFACCVLARLGPRSARGAHVPRFLEARCSCAIRHAHGTGRPFCWVPYKPQGKPVTSICLDRPARVTLMSLVIALAAGAADTGSGSCSMRGGTAPLSISISAITSSTAPGRRSGCSASTTRAPSTPAWRAMATTTATWTPPMPRRSPPGSQRGADPAQRGLLAGDQRPAEQQPGAAETPRGRLPPGRRGLCQRPQRPGLYVILDLHWTAPGNQVAGAAADARHDHSPAFWESVASTFKANPAVVFDVFNEPYDPPIRLGHRSRTRDR